MVEAGQVERVVVASLPAGVGRQRAGQLDAMVVGGGKDLPDADVARVDQMDVGQQVAGREVAVAALDRFQVGGGGVVTARAAVDSCGRWTGMLPRQAGTDLETSTGSPRRCCS
jgi:hypothetical protein